MTKKTLQDTQRGYAESLFSAANVDPASRELDIYTRMLDATAAERARKRLDLEERLKIKVDWELGQQCLGALQNSLL